MLAHLVLKNTLTTINIGIDKPELTDLGPHCFSHQEAYRHMSNTTTAFLKKFYHKFGIEEGVVVGNVFCSWALCVQN